MARNDLTADFVRSAFHYNPETGALWRRFRKSSKLEARYHKGGYLRVAVSNRKYLAHRVVWLWVYGEWPANEVDHINGVKDDNRLMNLRAVNRSVNQQNQRKPRVNNRSGYLGVHQGTKMSPQNRDFWIAKLRHEGATVYLGVFSTPKEAHEAYLEAKRRLHEGCTI